MLFQVICNRYEKNASITPGLYDALLRFVEENQADMERADEPPRRSGPSSPRP